MAEPLKTFSSRMQARKEKGILRGGSIEDDSKKFREKIRRDLEAAGIWGMYDDMVEEIGYDKKTLWEYKNVSENIKSSARAEELSYTHHREVVSLPPEEQERFLAQTKEETGG